MDPIVIVAFGGVLAGGMVTMMIFFKTRYLAPLPPQQQMPVLQVRRTRNFSSTPRRKTGLSSKSIKATTLAGPKRRILQKKTSDALVESGQVQGSAIAATTVAMDACPSCGLQAPGSLLAEHFLGSPSHKDGPPKPDRVVTAPTAQAVAKEETDEEASKESMRSLLQMLVPPRAFGRRHAQKAMSPISSMIDSIGPQAGRY